jgi:hypothetical protein
MALCNQKKGKKQKQIKMAHCNQKKGKKQKEKNLRSTPSN